MRYQEFAESQPCPECGGPSFTSLVLAEKQDACYHKVKSRYKVWPSAYASGALVQCRKKGAANWGNKSKNESMAEGANNIGAQIKAAYQKIYNAGDDAVEFAYYDSPIFAQYWDEYEGDLDSIIAEVDPSELQIILDELTAAAEDQDLNEFAPPGSNDGGDDGFSEETLKRLAAQWYNGDEDPRVERTLMAAGWEIGQDEGYDDEPGVFVVQSGDVNGNSYLSWPAHELKQGVAEAFDLHAKSTSNTNSSPELRGVYLPGAMKHPDWKEPTWSFQEIAQKLGVSTRELNGLVALYPGFPTKVQGIKSKYGSGAYYPRSEVKRWVNATDIRNILKSKQGVAEGSGDGYYYLQGGIERSKKFASEAEAMAHSKRFFQLARVSRVTLKYKEPGQPPVVVKEFSFGTPPPKSQMSWGDFYLQNKKQGMSEDAIAEMKNLAGLK